MTWTLDLIKFIYVFIICRTYRGQRNRGVGQKSYNGRKLYKAKTGSFKKIKINRESELWGDREEMDE